MRAWVVYPEVKSKAPVVVVIHENKGLTDWVRGFADQLAEAGYIAVAPDLLIGLRRRSIPTPLPSAVTTRRARRSTSSTRLRPSPT